MYVHIYIYIHIYKEFVVRAPQLRGVALPAMPNILCQGSG